MKVPVQISFRHLDSSNTVESVIHEKIAWLEHFCDQIISCHVVIEKPHEHHHRGNLFHVRIDLRLPGHELVISRGPGAHKAHKDIYVTIHDAFDEARRELEDYSRRRRVDVKNLSSPPHAFVVRLERDDGGFGFIRTADDREIYFHSNAVLNGQYDHLEIGSEVRFSEEMGEKGPQASTIEVVGKKHRRVRAA